MDAVEYSGRLPRESLKEQQLRYYAICVLAAGMKEILGWSDYPYMAKARLLLYDSDHPALLALSGNVLSLWETEMELLLAMNLEHEQLMTWIWESISIDFYDRHIVWATKISASE